MMMVEDLGVEAKESVVRKVAKLMCLLKLLQSINSIKADYITHQQFIIIKGIISFVSLSRRGKNCSQEKRKERCSAGKNEPMERCENSILNEEWKAMKNRESFKLHDSSLRLTLVRDRFISIKVSS
ncbi:uncharacterized protein LOC103496540 isoform X2 [Cucumis melo]|uniref:Uncharacterized protein LOC103496540 isoform X2 n=1 Tax=Cucumis melo TaxID=3656 RepID=A0ABM3KMA3_CUCME|nr:uncharacterized protein LOC103496540 isoform X2 [Cucumis melo]